MSKTDQIKTIIENTKKVNKYENKQLNKINEYRKNNEWRNDDYIRPDRERLQMTENTIKRPRKSP
jgi:hypothetical protein